MGMCGFFLREMKEGEGELTLFFDPLTSSESRRQFEEYVATHLQRRALQETIKRRRIFACSNCSETITDNQAKRRLERGLNSISCPVCDTEISLIDDRKSEALMPSVVREIDRAANAQREFDAGLISAAGEMRTQSFRTWAGASSATIALVFTDIVDSTVINNEVGDEAMNRLRKAHFQQARRLLDNYDGHEIKTIGDSLMIAFRTAVKAFDFALSIFSRTGSERIRVRVGIHVGAVHIDEEDAFGTMVNYASRVTSQGKDAEIWLSSAAKNDVDQEKARRHAELKWEAHPDCELKGFSGKSLLWSVNPRALRDSPKDGPISGILI
jgi:class 3 adenylate cyclase